MRLRGSERSPHDAQEIVDPAHVGDVTELADRRKPLGRPASPPPIRTARPAPPCPAAAHSGAQRGHPPGRRVWLADRRVPPHTSAPVAAATNRPLTVAALLLAMFMSAMEATVVGTAMPTVIADLGGIALYGWVGAAYLLASTVTVPLYGKLADLYGRKYVILFGIALFLVGSIASGMAGSIEALIAARALQGLGAGAMQPITLTIVGDIFSLEERGRVQGAFGSVWGMAGIAGPLLGGFLVDALSWRWVFWINVPFGIASMLVLMHAYAEKPVPFRTVHVDWLGAGAIAAASVLLLVGAERTWPAVTIPLGLVLLVAFVVIERRAKSPVVPIPLLLRPAIGVASLSSALLGAAMMGAVIFTPLYAQGVRFATPTEAGATIAPMLVGWPIASAVANRVVLRFGFRAPVWIGAAVVITGLTGHLFAIESGASLWAIRAAMFVYGLGMGLTVTAQLLAVQSQVSHDERGVATATNLFSRSMGGALGVGALGAVLAAALGEHLSPETVSALLSPHGARSASGDAVAAALGDALAPVWWTLAALALVNVVVVAFYPKDSVARATSSASIPPPAPTPLSAPVAD